MSKTKPSELVNRLRRRRDWLHERVTEARDKDLSYDQAELSALNWAIPILMLYISREEDHDSPLHAENQA